MPKIAANEVERALIMADAESGAERVTRAETDKRRNEFLEAFQNAARLRSIGYRVVMLRGRKSHAVQLVVRTCPLLNLGYNTTLTYSTDPTYFNGLPAPDS